MTAPRRLAAGVALACATLSVACTHPPNHAAPGISDPGVRGGAPGAGGPLPGLTADELAFFNDGRARFLEIESVTGGTNNGLGPRFNSNQCASCHSQPDIGGTSPPNNPQIAVASLKGAKNSIPWFIVANGPVREARFKTNPDGTPNGGVRALFVVTGRSDAAGCNIAQPDFLPAGEPLTGRGGNPNIIFRIPTPVFGTGLIEAIPDAAILANASANASTKEELGIHGHPNAHISGTANTSANDGTVTRFGWKAQNKSLLMFSGEAYNVEMGVTNLLFPQERDETPGCVFNPTPEDTLNLSASPATAVVSDIEAFGAFMRFLAPPAPAPDTPSIVNGRALFETAGCAACHTPTLRTAKRVASGSSKVPSAALSDQPVHLYSDLLLHHMGRGLDDGIVQGQAGSDEFRTAPLWGLGQRVFLLHDGRTTDLMEAIEAHRSRGSEASEVVTRFNRLREAEQQDILNFLRSL
ncbi:MAG TPA: di-heme oxidoredictase family protein [Anaeromyxobacteraceae bacterium]|nr:di-heme oxidoredictase family protein [Anaeromyxobacteraceae bacterium]